MKYISRILIFICFCISIFTLAVSRPSISTIVNENTLLNRSTLVLHCLKYKDLACLSTLVHPERGVTFSPYCYISEMDLNFSAAEIKNLSMDKPYIWGEYDGSGHTIELSFSEFHTEFIYSADFINAELIGNNVIVQTGGNTINNIRDAYPQGKFIEYNFSGFYKEYGGVDWESLRLVFEEINDEWYLVGVIHDAYSM